MKDPILSVISDACDHVLGFDISSSISKKEYVRGRSIYYYLAKNLTKKPLSIIGRQVGRDHATVLHNLKNFNRDILGDKIWLGFFSDVSDIVKFAFENQELDPSVYNAMKIDMLQGYITELKSDIGTLTHRLKVRGGVTDNYERKLLESFRGLNESEKHNAILKIETMLKVSNKMKTFVYPRQQINT